MDEFDTKRSNYVNLHETPLHSDSESLWKTYGTSISLGFVATAVLISMFLIMAIIEQFFRPNASFRFTQHANHRPDDPRLVNKLVDTQPHVSYFMYNFKNLKTHIVCNPRMVQGIKTSRL